jgi:hypothetical protein
MGFPKGLSELIYYYYIRLRCKQISSLAAMVESAHNAFSPVPFDWYFDELWIQLLGRNDEPKFSQNTDKSAFGLLHF